jgi:hypothetical protein
MSNSSFSKRASISPTYLIFISFFIPPGHLFVSIFIHILIFAIRILIALILAVIRKIAGKKSKTLVDYEPEEEDL